MNLGHLYFDIVSDFVLRFSYFASRGISTLVERSLQIHLFMQNKANFRKVKLNVNKVLTKDYDKMDTWSSGKKQSQTNPNKAKLKKAKMNVTSILTVGYENKPPFPAPKKQSQISKRQKLMQTSLPQRIMKNTALSGPEKTKPNKPKQTQFQCSVMLNCAICSDNTSTGPGKFRESTDTLSYYDRENTLVKCCDMAMIMPNVAYTMFRPKGNSNSRSKYAFEVETIQFGGKPL